MYFYSRSAAGQKIADQLEPNLRYENNIILALDDGGVIVGFKLAIKLHCLIMLVSIDELTVPGESNPIGALTVGGQFSYNQDFSSGEIDEFLGDYREYLEEEKLVKIHKINQLIGHGGYVELNMLKYHNVIIVSEGLVSTIKLNLIEEFLKPIKIEKLIVALPLASVQVIDKIHVMADKIICLDVIDSPLPIDHFYQSNDVPSHEKIITIIKDIILHWK